MLLSGRFELTIDAKNRMSVPFGIRRNLDPERDGQSFYILPGQRRGTLALYPEKYYERVAPIPPEGSVSEEVQEYVDWLAGNTFLLEPDSQGRVLLPDHLLRRQGIGKEVVLTGARDHLLLWKRAAFEQFDEGGWAGQEARRPRALQELRALTAERPAAGSAP